MRNPVLRVTSAYDADFDVIPGGPRVTWAEKALADAVIELQNEVLKLKTQFEYTPETPAPKPVSAAHELQWWKHSRYTIMETDTYGLQHAVALTADETYFLKGMISHKAAFEQGSSNHIVHSIYRKLFKKEQ